MSERPYLAYRPAVYIYCHGQGPFRVYGTGESTRKRPEQVPVCSHCGRKVKVAW